MNKNIKDWPQSSPQRSTESRFEQLGPLQRCRRIDNSLVSSHIYWLRRIYKPFLAFCYNNFNLPGAKHETKLWNEDERKTEPTWKEDLKRKEDRKKRKGKDLCKRDGKRLKNGTPRSERERERAKPVLYKYSQNASNKSTNELNVRSWKEHRDIVKNERTGKLKTAETTANPKVSLHPIDSITGNCQLMWCRLVLFGCCGRNSMDLDWWQHSGAGGPSVKGRDTEL